jgi:hypothetical protein
MIAWLLLASGFLGPQACEPCHAAIFERQAKTHHAHALRPAAELAPLLSPLKERGGASLRYEGDGGTAVAELAGEIVRMPLVWAFGAGAQAVTPVGLLGGRFVEHRVSWYRRKEGLALTPGHDPNPSRDAESALGIMQPPRTAYRCFHCHATNVERGADGGPILERSIAGVTCERCHGPGRAHVEAARAGKPLRGTILHPGRFAPRQQTEMCAECHRSPDTVFQSAMPELENPAAIRFAPVGLMASRCYQKSGGISCLACHSPHDDPLPSNDASYVKVCLGCHAKTKAHRNVSAVGNCLSCHMQRSEGAPYLYFTDHRIRIYPPDRP